MKKNSKHELILISVILSMVTACNSSLPVKELHIGVINLTIPAKWQVVRLNGLDSYVAYVITESNDTFHLEYGDRRIINNIYDPVPVVFSIKDMYLMEKEHGSIPPRDEVLFSDSPKEDMEQNIFDPNYYRYDTIQGIVVKMILPKKSGTGTIGMYVPSLKDSSAFSIYIKNAEIDLNNHALKIYQSLKYQ